MQDLVLKREVQLITEFFYSILQIATFHMELLSVLSNPKQDNHLTRQNEIIGVKSRATVGKLC